VPQAHCFTPLYLESKPGRVIRDDLSSDAGWMGTRLDERVDRVGVELSTADAALSCHALSMPASTEPSGVMDGDGTPIRSLPAPESGR
jgi:hypothetical protein